MKGKRKTKTCLGPGKLDRCSCYSPKWITWEKFSNLKDGGAGVKKVNNNFKFRKKMNVRYQKDPAKFFHNRVMNKVLMVKS